ncbi:MAG: metallophosphoesterase family protein [Chlorobi bacterium]|nr:metallophosphoesterase family protein [Chlorobiota bacterium]
MAKKIVLLSDTHGTYDDFIDNHIREADEIWHAGDIGTPEVLDRLEAVAPVRAVYGNIDGKDIRIRVPEYLVFDVEGLKVLMLHIGGYPGKYTPRAKELIARYRPDLFISGHSHILKVIRDPAFDLLHMNPGAAGKSGFHKVRTLLRFEAADGKLQNLEVVERPR